MPSAPPIDLWGMVFNATSELIFLVLFGLFVFVVWFMWTFIFPPVAKTYIKSKLGMGRGRAIFNVTGDEGYKATFLGIPLPQGVVNISNPRKPRFIILGRAFLPEAPIKPSLVDTNGNEFNETKKTELNDQYEKAKKDYDELLASAPTYTDFSLKRAFRAGVNRPEYEVYSGKAIAVSTASCAALGLPVPKTGEKNSWSKFKIFTRIGHPELEEKTDAEILFGTLIDSRILKTTIQALYTDAQLRKIHQDAFIEGQESVRGSTHNFFPIFIIILLLIGGVIALKIAGVF